MTFDNDRLKERIWSFGGQEKVANEMGLSAVSLNLKLKNTRELKRSEVIKLQQILDISNDEFMSIFFAH